MARQFKNEIILHTIDDSFEHRQECVQQMRDWINHTYNLNIVHLHPYMTFDKHEDDIWPDRYVFYSEDDHNYYFYNENDYNANGVHFVIVK